MHVWGCNFSRKHSTFPASSRPAGYVTEPQAEPGAEGGEVSAQGGAEAQERALPGSESRYSQGFCWAGLGRASC